MGRNEVDAGAAQRREARCRSAVQGAQSVGLVHAVAGAWDQAHVITSVIEIVSSITGTAGFMSAHEPRRRSAVWTAVPEERRILRDMIN